MNFTTDLNAAEAEIKEPHGMNSDDIIHSLPRLLVF